MTNKRAAEGLTALSMGVDIGDFNIKEAAKIGANALILLDGIKDGIKLIKLYLKSENSDYLTGYICALSAVEGMIAEVEIEE